MRATVRKLIIRDDVFEFRISGSPDAFGKALERLKAGILHGEGGRLFSDTDGSWTVWREHEAALRDIFECRYFQQDADGIIGGCSRFIIRRISIGGQGEEAPSARFADETPANRRCWRRVEYESK